MHRILIADPSVKDTDYIKNKLQDGFEVAVCPDGRLFHILMREFDPDVLFLDLQLPNADGLTLLRDVRAIGNMIPVIVASAYLPNYLQSILGGLNIATALRKPCSIDLMLDKICEILQENPCAEQWSMGAELDYILFRLGFKAGPTRYMYVRCAVLLRFEKENISLTKELYPTVANLVAGTTVYVEKGIRDAIRYARKVGDPDLWQSFFPALQPQKIPTNEEFLGRIVAALHNRERPRKQMEDLFKEAVIL